MENNYIETMQAEYATDEDSPVYSKFMEYKRAKVDPLKYTSNKDINIKTIDSIYVKNFRSLKERKLELGKHITIITGKNGTMKSSLLGLIAHPFSPSGDDVKDVFGDILKTDMKDVFRLSLEKDKDQYEYFILLTSDKDEKIIEPIRIFLSSDDKRHRVVVSGKNKGDGNFNMKTNYVNLQRLFPIINTQAKETEIQLTDKDKEFLEMAYQQIIQKTEYSKSSTVQEKALKRTLSPKDSYYDYNSISSGEDNLGAILLRLLSFKKLVDEKSKQNMLQGVLCIDEIEASLHPSAVINLFEFLLKFSRKNNIQIVFTTHSLHLMQYCLDRYIKVTNNDEIKINNISTVMVGSDRNYNVVINPEYSNICKELTYNSDKLINLYKVNVLCEDKIAEKFIKTIIKTQKINNAVSFVADEEGIAYSGIIALAKNSKKILEDFIFVVDADVDDEKVSKAKNEALLKLPDRFGFAIEKAVVLYLLELDGTDSFFKDIDMEKGAIENQMTNCDININVEYVKTKAIHYQIDQCKSWCKQNYKIFSKALTRLVRDNEEYYCAFREKIISLINNKRADKSLPPIEQQG